MTGSLRRCRLLEKFCVINMVMLIYTFLFVIFGVGVECELTGVECFISCSFYCFYVFAFFSPDVAIIVVVVITLLQCVCVFDIYVVHNVYL